MLQSLDVGDEKTQSDHRNENPLCQQPPSGIEVLIVGGGVAGLYFALESLRQGHKPLVIESKLEDEQPAGMNVICITKVYT
jgi:NADPH-dependent 2,4-dienoyl-CoA reductase/sulfur reductase-like enzyme